MKNVWVLEDDYHFGIKIFSNPKKLYNYLVQEKLIIITYNTFLKKLTRDGWYSGDEKIRRSSAYKKEVH